MKEKEVEHTLIRIEDRVKIGKEPSFRSLKEDEKKELSKSYDNGKKAAKDRSLFKK